MCPQLHYVEAPLYIFINPAYNFPDIGNIRDIHNFSGAAPASFIILCFSPQLKFTHFS